MTQYLYRRTRIITALTLYPFLFLLMGRTSALLDLLKIEPFSVGGALLIMSVFALGYAFYAYVHETVICKREP